MSDVSTQDDEPPRVIRVFRWYALVMGTVCGFVAAGSAVSALGSTPAGIGDITGWIALGQFAALAVTHVIASLRRRGSRWWTFCRITMWLGVTNVFTLAPSIVFLVLWHRARVTSWYFRTPWSGPPRRA